MTFAAGHALIIGIGSYQHVPCMNVPITLNDAKQVAEVLTDAQYCGYPPDQVTLLSGARATRAGILAALDQLAARTSGHDDATVVLFYAGHGDFGSDDYYLTTHDTQITAADAVKDGTGIRARELLEKVRAIPARRVLLLFNACYSGALSPNALGTSASATATGHSLPDDMATALLSTGAGRVVITACRAQQQSYFDPTAHTTVFGQALADGLRGGDGVSRRGYISVFELYDYTYTQVKDTVQAQFGAQQEPELTMSKGVGVMAVALYQGATPSGTMELGRPPATLPGAARAVDRTESDQKLEQILKGQINLAAGRDITGNTNVGRDQVHGPQANVLGPVTHQSGGVNFGAGNTITNSGDIVGGDKVQGDKSDARESQGFFHRPTGPVTQHFGQQRTITTGGGDYAEGNIDKRKGFFGAHPPAGTAPTPPL